MGKGHDCDRESGLGALVDYQSDRRVSLGQGRGRVRVGGGRQRQGQGRKGQEFDVWTLSLGFRSTAHGPFGHTSRLRSRSQWRGQRLLALHSAQRQRRSSLFFFKKGGRKGGRIESEITSILSVSDSATTKEKDRKKNTDSWRQDQRTTHQRASLRGLQEEHRWKKMRRLKREG